VVLAGEARLQLFRTRNFTRCTKRTSPVRITTEGNDLKQQTAPHNHAVDVVDTQVKAVQSDMRKRAREEITPVPAIYDDHLIKLNILYGSRCKLINANETFSHFVRGNGIRPNGIRQSGIRQSGNALVNDYTFNTFNAFNTFNVGHPGVSLNQSLDVTQNAALCTLFNLALDNKSITCVNIHWEEGL